MLPNAAISLLPFSLVMVPDVSREVQFRFSRSGGAGGQNVNKVETAATAFWNIGESQLLDTAQRELLLEKLAHRLAGDGVLIVKSQEHRTQLANKEAALKKLQQLVHKALEKRKPRIATRASKASKEKRLQQKKQRSDVKKGRNKQNWQ
ncbi:MAG: aminoacyl-tRNA hydrolase [Chitinophagaceae bacterium]|nr:aminoacyl-tRNA hydrolase [Chitinophagaceae bacterium]